MRNKLRIIAGEWRSRQLSFEDAEGLRPTPARVRETLFNWLRNDVFGGRCLDLYAGSGALGVEAASRGAAYVVQVERNALACHQLKANCGNLEARQIKIVQQDVLRFLAGDAEPFDLVFLDPPFGKKLAEETCQRLEDKGWLVKQAKVYVEVEKGFALKNIPDNWHQLNKKSAGEVDFYLYERD